MYYLKGKSIEDIRKDIDADKLIYLSKQGLDEVVSKTYNCGICSGCFGGKYPIKPEGKINGCGC